MTDVTLLTHIPPKLKKRLQHYAVESGQTLKDSVAELLTLALDEKEQGNA
jgi:hypothetical protein